MTEESYIDCVDRLGLSLIRQTQGFLDGAVPGQIILLLVDAMDDLLRLATGSYRTSREDQVMEILRTLQRALQVPIQTTSCTVALLTRLALALQHTSQTLLQASTMLGILYGDASPVRGLAGSLEAYAQRLAAMPLAVEAVVV